MSLKFQLDDDQVKRITEWDDPVLGHPCTVKLNKVDGRIVKDAYSADDRLTYIFTPTNMGDIVVVRCDICNQELVVTNPLSFPGSWEEE